MITKDNYEIFYLDYLDGNLTASESAELLLFLTENPELELEDDNLPTIIDDTNYSDKQSLKVFNEDETITASNAENFAIAAEEGILADRKKAELSVFLNKNKGLKREVGIYANTKLTPNPFEVYTNKKGLKKKEGLVLLPWIAAAASVAIVVGSISFFSTQTPNAQYALNEKLDLEIENSTISDINWRTAELIDEGNPTISSNYSYNINQSFVADNEKSNPTLRNKFEDLKLEKLSLKKESIAAFKKGKQLNLPDLTDPSAVAEDKPINNNLDFKEMNNPIWAITNVVGAVTNKDIDFRNAKATEEKAGGFRIKIGNFEIYKKKSKKM